MCKLPSIISLVGVAYKTYLLLITEVNHQIGLKLRGKSTNKLKWIGICYR
jgi:hypothetical protein